MKRMPKKLLALLLAALMMWAIGGTVIAASLDADSSPEEVADAAPAEEASEAAPDAEEPADEAEDPAEDADENEPAEDADQEDDLDGEDADEGDDAEVPEEPEEDGKPVSKPAKTFKGKKNGITVTVKANAGTFPAGTTMKLSSVDMDKVKAAVGKVVDEDVLSVKALGITFYKDGKRIQPAKAVRVQLKAGAPEGADGREILAITNLSNGTAKVISHGGAFKTSRLNVFAIVDLAGDEPAAPVEEAPAAPAEPAEEPAAPAEEAEEPEDAEEAEEINFDLEDADDADGEDAEIDDEEFDADLVEEEEEEPAEEAEPVKEEEPAEEAEEPEEEPLQPGEKRVTIYDDRRDVMEVGEIVTLYSRLQGFEDCRAIKYQWECDKGDGFKAVAGGDKETFSFAATAESLSWDWRLTVFWK